eukprot:scaffold23856_cov106-Isochrysis_galbana.AAC.1
MCVCVICVCSFSALASSDKEAEPYPDRPPCLWDNRDPVPASHRCFVEFICGQPASTSKASSDSCLRPF